MTSKTDLAFSRLLRAFNKKQHVWKRTKAGKNIATPGRWTLDIAFGGARVAEITNKGGGESDPFGSRRRKPAEFVRWVNDIITARNISRKR